MDKEMDAAIGDVVRKAFADCTVVTIAHRLDTIINCDKVLVMVDGTAAEFGPPQQLLKDEAGVFTKLWRSHTDSEAPW